MMDWWIAQENSKLCFENILSGKDEGKLIVVCSDKTKNELTTERIERITEDGVITKEGVLYPLEEAHIIYMLFLVESSKPNTVIASNWAYYPHDLSPHRAIADIIHKDEVKKDVIFRFHSNEGVEVLLSAYSRELLANVVFNSFDRRNISGTEIPKELKKMIYSSSFVENKKRKEIIANVKRIYREKMTA